VKRIRIGPLTGSNGAVEASFATVATPSAARNVSVDATDDAVNAPPNSPAAATTRPVLPDPLDAPTAPDLAGPDAEHPDTSRPTATSSATAHRLGRAGRCDP